LFGLEIEFCLCEAGFGFLKLFEEFLNPPASAHTTPVITITSHD
jgi:hypothetical protein